MLGFDIYSANYNDIALRYTTLIKIFYVERLSFSQAQVIQLIFDHV